MWFSYHYQNRWCRCHFVDLDHGEYFWHLSFDCACVEEPGGSQKDTVDTTERGHGHKDGDHEGERPVHSGGESLKVYAVVVRYQQKMSIKNYTHYDLDGYEIEESELKLQTLDRVTSV